MALEAEVFALVEMRAADEAAALATRSFLDAALPCEVSSPRRTPGGFPQDPRAAPPLEGHPDAWYVTARGKLHVPVNVGLARGGMWFGSQLADTLRAASGSSAPPLVQRLSVRPAAPDLRDMSADSQEHLGCELVVFLRSPVKSTDAGRLRDMLHSTSSLTLVAAEAVGRTMETLACQVRGILTSPVTSPSYVAAAVEAAVHRCGLAPAVAPHPYVEIGLISRVRLSGGQAETLGVPLDRTATASRLPGVPAVAADAAVGGRALPVRSRWS